MSYIVLYECIYDDKMISQQQHEVQRWERFETLSSWYEYQGASLHRLNLKGAHLNIFRRYGGTYLTLEHDGHYYMQKDLIFIIIITCTNQQRQKRSTKHNARLLRRGLVTVKPSSVPIKSTFKRKKSWTRPYGYCMTLCIILLLHVVYLCMCKNHF